MLNLLLVFFLINPCYSTGQMFQHVKVEGGGGHYTISGETERGDGKYFYLVEDGHDELVKEKPLLIKHSFKIKIDIPSSKLPQNGTVILNLYERNSLGKPVHSYPIVLERFN